MGVVLVIGSYCGVGFTIGVYHVRCGVGVWRRAVVSMCIIPFGVDVDPVNMNKETLKHLGNSMVATLS